VEYEMLKVLGSRIRSGDDSEIAQNQSSGFALLFPKK
jgi:hypothetical protein